MKPTFRLAPLSELHEDPKNARRHGSENRAVVRSSLAEFGQVEALVVERGTGLVIGGNCRLQELRDLGRTEAWISEVDVHGAKAKRLALVLNRSAELAEWNNSTLSDALRELEADAGGLEGIDGLGWNSDELERLLGHKPGGGLGGPPPIIDPDEDDIPEPPADPESKPGGVYELGPHRLVCGDSTKAATWDAILSGEVQMVWTDPPYGVAVNAVASVEEARRLHRRTDGKVVLNDALTPEQLLVFLRASLGAMFARCAPGAVWYAAAPPGPLHNVFGTVLIELDVWRRSIVWLKDRFAFGRGDYHYRHEPIFYGWKPGAAHYFCDDRTQDTVHEFPRPSRSEEHPTMKPIDLVRRHIRNSSKEGWVVADPFGGSGTTLLAAAAEGRIARLIELDPGYCDVIRRRWTRYAKANNLDAGSGGLEG